jgi:hypothetical protein
VSDDPLRSRLTRLAKKTATAERLEAGGWWVRDIAGRRRVQDDLAAGRLHWLSAHNMARRGIEALEAGDRDMALLCAWSATDLYVEALEGRARPSDIKALARPSQRRGRPRKKSASPKK